MEYIEEIEHEEVVDTDSSQESFDDYGFNDDNIFGNNKYGMTSDEEEEDTDVIDYEEKEEPEAVDETTDSINQTDTPDVKTDTDVSVEPPTIFDSVEIPSQFKSDKHRADFFQKAYEKSVQTLNGDVKNKFLEIYKNELVSTERNVDIAREVVDALQNGQSMQLLRKYFAKELTQNGYNLKYSPEEMQDIVDQKLSEKFGPNYQDEYDVNQLRLVGSKSYQIFKEQNRLMDQLEAENEQFAANPIQSMPQQVQVDEGQRMQYIEDSYKDFQGIVDKDYYNKWVNEDLPKVYQNLKPIDLFKLQNIGQLIEAARSNERKKLYEEIRLAGGKKVEYDDDKPQTSKRTTRYNSQAEYYAAKDKAKSRYY